ncbi:MAG: ornithine carbamoyltransferase [Proteobacteria bacterium]|nr:ornithine carbamoyltransferase [Pseudomonadota bacterium]
MSSTAPSPRHFLDIHKLDRDTLRGILDAGVSLKATRRIPTSARPLQGRTLVMIFEKPSTRTRVSFQIGMQELGGEVVILSDTDSQLGRGETVADTARVLSRYADAIMIRTDDPEKLRDLEKYATVPVINGLTDRSHPCQIMADIMTYEEHRGAIEGRKVAWSGDGNNVVASWVHAAVRFGFEIRIASPAELQPRPDLIEWAREAGARVVLTDNPAEAVHGADLVVTDTWVSMGDTDTGSRHNLLSPYRVDERLMERAAADALFMHCLPAHRGDEVSGAVIDGPQSVVWDEAENRLHVQKAILSWCLN